MAWCLIKHRENRCSGTILVQRRANNFEVGNGRAARCMNLCPCRLVSLLAGSRLGLNISFERVGPPPTTAGNRNRCPPWLMFAYKFRGVCTISALQGNASQINIHLFPEYVPPPAFCLSQAISPHKSMKFSLWEHICVLECTNMAVLRTFEETSRGVAR
jgi:hypothetical protein